MGKIILDQEALGLSSIFERISRARVTDCFKDEDTIYFIISQGFMGKALGKGAINVKKMQQKYNKKIKLVEHSDDVVKFIRNFIAPLKVESIIQDGDVIEIKDSSKKTKSLLIGRGGKNLDLLKRAVNRFFPVEITIAK